MLKRALIVNWKWELDYSKGIDVDSSTSTSSKIFSSKHKQNEIQTLIEFVDSIKSEKTIILLHKNSPNNFEENHKTSFKFNKSTTKIQLFGGGGEAIYCDGNENSGLLDQNGKFYDPITDEYSVFQNSKIKSANFNYVWDWYWNKLELETLKKKMIDSLLPLSFDVQGLSEVDEKIKEEYFNGLNKDYYNKLDEDCKEIIDDFKKYFNEKIDEEFNSYKKYFNDKISLLDKAKTYQDITDKNFLNPKSDMFLPKKLQQLSEKFNKLIAAID